MSVVEAPARAAKIAAMVPAAPRPDHDHAPHATARRRVRAASRPVALGQVAPATTMEATTLTEARTDDMQATRTNGAT